jgi:hypothetical protein
MSDVPLPTDAQLRAWAREQLSDSRFMHLPADLLRVLIVHTSIASVDAYRNTMAERAKEKFCKLGQMDFALCPCGELCVQGDYVDDITTCTHDECDVRVCVQKCPGNVCCDSCGGTACSTHADLISHVCSCKQTYCVRCIDTTDELISSCHSCNEEICYRCRQYGAEDGIYLCMTCFHSPK